MRFHDSLVGLFFMVLGALVLWQVASFPSMPGQLIGPGTFPSIFGYAFLIGGAIIFYQSRRERLRQWLALNPGWLMRDRLIAVVLAIGGAFVLGTYFEEIGFTIGMSVLMSAVFLALGYRPLFWIAISVAFSVATYYGIAKGLTVPLPLGILS